MLNTRVSIIIRCKNEEAFIGRVLEGVFAQETSQSFEVIVIDSGSTDGTLGIVSGFDCRLVNIPPERFSYGYSMNLGAELAIGEILVYLSAHCPPAGRDWLDKLTASLTEPDVSAVFGRQMGEPGVNPFEEWRLARAFPAGQAGLQKYMFSSANAALRRSAWDVLPFDEGLPFSEDRLWAKEASFRGMKIAYVPESVVYHSHLFSMSGVFNRARAAGWAKKEIYGEECRFDSLAWIAGAFCYCVLKDLTHFIANGYWGFIGYIPRYRWLELAGFRRGALDNRAVRAG